MAQQPVEIPFAELADPSVDLSALIHEVGLVVCRFQRHSHRPNSDGLGCGQGGSRSETAHACARARAWRRRKRAATARLKRAARAGRPHAPLRPSQCGPPRQGFGPDGLGIVSVSGVPDFPALRERLLPLAAALAALPDAARAALEDAASNYNVGWSHGKEALAGGRPDTLKGGCGAFAAGPKGRCAQHAAQRSDSSAGLRRVLLPPWRCLASARGPPPHPPTTFPTLWPPLGSFYANPTRDTYEDRAASDAEQYRWGRGGRGARRRGAGGRGSVQQPLQRRGRCSRQAAGTPETAAPSGHPFAYREGWGRAEARPG